MGAPAARKPRWFQRIGWLLVLWFAGVAALAVVALLLRALLQLAGLRA